MATLLSVNLAHPRENRGRTVKLTGIDKRPVAGGCGAYLRVFEPGTVEAGAPVEVVFRPGHGVTSALTFRALSTEPDLIRRLVGVEALAEEIKEKVARRLARTAP